MKLTNLLVWHGHEESVAVSQQRLMLVQKQQQQQI